MSKYNEKEALEKLEMFKKGATMAMYAAELDVSIRTVQFWLDPNSQQFKKTLYIEYMRALAKQEAHYDKVILREFEKPTENFNAVLYQMVRRNLHGWTEHRKITCLQDIKHAETYYEQQQVLRDALADGHMTPAEFAILSRAIVELAKMLEIDKLKSEIDELKAYVKNETQQTQAQEETRHG
jgi:hypothetical protein